MSAAVEKEFVLEGICCANCASKIEHAIGNIPEIDSASVDFVSETLRVGITNSDDVKTSLEQISKVVKKYDSDVLIHEKPQQAPGKRSIFLDGLCCAECAQKIEEGVRRLDGVEDASLDFISGQLSITAYDKKALPSIIRHAAEVARRVEPDVEISFSRASSDQATTSHEKQEHTRRVLLAAGAVLYSAALLIKGSTWITIALFLGSYLLVGGEVLLRSIRSISKGQIFDENFLMSIATIGALGIGEFAEAVAVMLFYQVGELFQRLAVERSRRSVASLMDIRPAYANLIDGKRVLKVAPEELGVGEYILVRPGEKIPVDGKITHGYSALDVSALTGESVPKDVGVGDQVLSGSVNGGGALTVEVLKEYSDSTVAKILDLVQNARSKKAATENFITKFARYYTPAVVGAAAALALIPPLVLGEPMLSWLSRSLVFLVVSCPCALVISVPLSFFGGIGAASKNGLLIKGSNYLEALSSVDTFVFDKTGTLTEGSFRISEIRGRGAISKDRLLEIAAYAEASSKHPIALSICQSYDGEIDRGKISEVSEVAGWGVCAKIAGSFVLVGNSKLMDAHKISYEQDSASGTSVYVAIDGSYAGCILISDEIKKDSAQALKQLRSSGVQRLIMLTGDSVKTAKQVGDSLGLDEIYADLLPQQKVERFEAIKAEGQAGKKAVFVGDGINDAPVLAMADVGCAMGAAGSEAAIEAADVVLMTDEPSRLPALMRIAYKTHRIVWENIIFALSVKAVILILGALGIATMWAAVFNDVGVAVIAILNAMRALYVPADKQNGTSAQRSTPGMRSAATCRE